MLQGVPVKTLYRFRGIVLGLLAVLLWSVPPTEQGIPASAGVLALVGFVVRIEARRVIGEHTRGAEQEAPRLVTEGIYSRVRHPLYLSNLSFCYAFALFHLGLSLKALAFAVLVTLFEYGLSRSEDSFLKKRFGDSFDEWKKTVPLFIPQIRVANAPSAFKRSALAAFFADRWTWLWLLFYTLSLILRRQLDLPFAFG